MKAYSIKSSNPNEISLEGLPKTFKDAPVLPVAQVVAKEQEIAASGTPLKELMARAGQGIFDYLDQNFPNTTQRAAVVLAGAGNNGGDGWVVADLLARKHWRVSLVTVKLADQLKAEPARETALELTAHWKIQPEFAPEIHLNPSSEELLVLFSQADVIIDGILGTGFVQGSLRNPFDEWISLANQEHAKRKVFTLAIDIPSGLSADTGFASNPCFVADATISMIVFKPAFILPECNQFIGEAVLAPLV